MDTAAASRYTVRGLALAAVVSLVGMSGCETGGQTGAVAGAGVGALIGQAAGGDTEATLIGAAIGTGVGYLIGNEVDKSKAKEMSASSVQASRPAYEHTETTPLAGTRWNLVNLSPADAVEPYTSKIVEFRNNGRIVTTTTHADGTVSEENESYRVVADTLIINHDDYIINARFNVAGDELVISAEEFSAVLRQLR